MSTPPFPSQPQPAPGHASSPAVPGQQPPFAGPNPPVPGQAPQPFGPPQAQARAIKVRYSPAMGVLFVPLGVLWLILAIATHSKLGYVLGPLFVIVGSLFLLTPPLAIVTPDSIVVKSPLQFTMKTLPIHGLRDLHFEGEKLYRSGDRKKIAHLGWANARSGDRQALQHAIAAARGHR